MDQVQGKAALQEPLPSLLIETLTPKRVLITLELPYRRLIRGSSGKKNLFFDHSQKDLDGAKLRMFSSIDSPVTPQNRGLDFFYQGITDEMVQARRDLMLGTSRQDMIDLSGKYLLDKLNKKDSTKVIFGSDNDQVSLYEAESKVCGL